MRKRNFLWNIILIILLLLFGSELILPRIAEKKLSSYIASEAESIESLNIKVSSLPSIKILLNKFDFVEIDAAGVKIDNIYLDQFSGEFNDVRLVGGRVKGNNTDLKIIISEDALNNYLEKQYPTLENFDVVLSPGKIFLSGYLNFLEARINVQLAGKLVMEGVNRVHFIPEELQVENINISAALFKDLIEDKGFYFNLNTLELPVNIEKIIISEDKIMVVGGKSARKAGV